MTKAISAVIATVMLLMITVSLVGVFYVFSSTMASQTTSSGSEQASQLTAQLSMCMQVDNIIGNQIILRNCGKGVIENKSLVVTMDDIVLGANTNTILEGNSSVVNVSGLWQIPFGKHNLKISNGAAVAQSLVEIIPNPDGLAGSWNFDEGSGAKAYDASGNGNVGTLTNMNTAGNATSGWADGKFREGLQFDGFNDYIDAGNGASLQNTFNINASYSFSAWVNVFSDESANGRIIFNYASGSNNIHGLNYRSGKFRAGIYNGTSYIFTKSGTANLNAWHNVVIAFNGIAFNLYVDGVSQSGTDTPYLSGSSKLTIGSENSGNSKFFNGTIDEVRIWSKALAPDETVTMKRII